MLRSFCLLLVLALAQRVAAQTTASTALPIDITAAKADPRTRIFDDNKTTVGNYIYAVLEKQSACCGNDAIYLEVVVRPDGTTESAKALTGRNDCLKRTVEDILKDIRWDVGAATKTQRIYFDLKPALACGNGKNNQYVEMTLAAQEARRLGIQKPSSEPALASAETPAPATQTKPAETTPPSTPVEAKPAEAPPVEQPAARPAPAKPAAKPVEPALTTPPQENSWSDPAPTQPVAEAPRPARTRPAPVQPKPAPVAVAAIPGARYVSAGDRSPDPSHAKSHSNSAGPQLTTPEYVDGESMKAVFIKQELRKSGICGLAHVLAELTVDKDGTVKAQRIFQANDPKVREAITPILASLKYKPETVRFRQTIYLEVKADVECPNGPQSKVNLDQVDNYLQQTRDSR